MVPRNTESRYLEICALTKVPVVAEPRREREAAETLVDRLVGDQILRRLAESVHRCHLQLLIKTERREDFAESEAGSLEPFLAEEALDHVRILDSMQVVPVRGVLLPDRHQESTQLQLEAEGERRRRQKSLLDADSFDVIETNEHIAAKVRIDGGLKGDLHLPDAKPRAVFLRASFRRQIADKITDDADVGEQSRIRRRGARSHWRWGGRVGPAALQLLELLDEGE